MTAISSATSLQTSSIGSFVPVCLQKCISDWKHAAIMISKLAACIFFPCISVVAACALAPITWAVVVVPTVAVASAVASYFCFKHIAPDLEPQIVHAPLPPGAPRGIERKGVESANCWINSLFQMLHADPNVKAWLLSDECPNELAPFKEFMQAYDDAYEKGLPVVPPDSQLLRRCIARIIDPSVSRSRRRHEDPTEGWMAIEGFLPDALRGSMQLTRHYFARRQQVQIAPGEECRPTSPQPVVSLAVAIRGEDPSLESLMDAHCNQTDPREEQPLRIRGVDGKQHNYRPVRVTTTFPTAPPSLWVNFKRFNSEGGKVETLIEIPDTYDLTLASKKKVRYELNSFMVHMGDSIFGGHYISFRKGPGDGLWYKIDDHRVTELSENQMLAWRRQAYFIQYSAARA
jgi:hypothetical protein